MMLIIAILAGFFLLGLSLVSHAKEISKSKERKEEDLESGFTKKEDLESGYTKKKEDLESGDFTSSTVDDSISNSSLMVEENWSSSSSESSDEEWSEEEVDVTPNLTQRLRNLILKVSKQKNTNSSVSCASTSFCEAENGQSPMPPPIMSPSRLSLQPTRPPPPIPRNAYIQRCSNYQFPQTTNREEYSLGGKAQLYN